MGTAPLSLEEANQYPIGLQVIS
ncbi:hypothetical protein EMIT0P4_250037 [Pseudomonas sp. IT-P4]